MYPYGELYDVLASADDANGTVEVVAVAGVARAAGRGGTEGVVEDVVDAAAGVDEGAIVGVVAAAVAVAPARSQGFGGEGIVNEDGGGQ